MKKKFMIQIIALPAFADNYIWMILNTQTKTALAVDPGDSTPVIKALAHYQVRLAGILVTHHHGDHIGGINALIQAFNVSVYGPEKEKIPHCNDTLKEGDRFFVEAIGLEFSVLEIPGHTLGHIAFVTEIKNQTHLFCGDTLFAGGCGRLFEGTPQQMYQSLTKLKQLPPETLVYCAHEYTLSNLQFALAVEPDNISLHSRMHAVQTLRKNLQASVPSLLKAELETNPFLRCENPTIKKNAETHAKTRLNDAIEVFRVIREWKDGFRV